jgi:hypothetical protein
MSPNTIEGLLDDFAEFDSFAKVVKRHPRTVDRWTKEPDGLPYTWMGKTKLVHLPTARQWLLGRMKRPNPRRKRGRA